MNPQYMPYNGPPQGYQQNRPPNLPPMQNVPLQAPTSALQQPPAQNPSKPSIPLSQLPPFAAAPNMHQNMGGPTSMPAQNMNPGNPMPAQSLPNPSIQPLQMSSQVMRNTASIRSNGQDSSSVPRSGPPGGDNSQVPTTDPIRNIQRSPNPHEQNQATHESAVLENSAQVLGSPNFSPGPTTQNSLPPQNSQQMQNPFPVQAQHPGQKMSQIQNQNQPMQNQNVKSLPNQMPGQIFSHQNMPLPNQNIPSSTPNQPKMSTPGQNIPTMPGQNLPLMPGQNVSPMSGQNLPPMPGQSFSPMPGQNLPPMAGQNVPPMSGQNLPPMPGQNLPPMPGQNLPPMPGQNLPPIPGQSLPPMPGQNLPPITGQNQPPMQGLHNNPSMSGQNPLMPPVLNNSQQNINNFNQPPKMGMSTRGPFVPGQAIPGPNQNQPPMPGQNFHNQPPMPGKPPLLNQNNPGQQMPPTSQPLMSQPPLQGQHSNRPPMPGQYTNRPPMPGQAGNQFNTPPMAGQPNTQFSKPPIAGPGQFNQPPMPGQGNHFNQPPLPGQQPRQFTQPPMPGTNQLSNQMQGMSLGGNYPGNVMNGDNTPHMPPPLNQGYGSPQSRQGYPPMPGQPGMGSPNQYPSQQNYQQQQQQQQQRRLDPDQMPSPIQVVQDDQANRSGVFCTNQKGLVPPLVSTKFVVQDQGFASPRFIRSTMYNVPATNDLIKQTAVPFGLVISPMARLVDGELTPPIVNFNELGPVRCIRCKAYMCPFMQFIDSGRRFQCLFCKASTDVPAEYFQHLDVSGQRLDKYERPELVLGTYEFVATTDYCRNNTPPKPPAIIFVIDVSYNNVKSGLVHLLCSQMKDIIKNLPIDEGNEKSNMKVGFITYNSSVHFYNIKGNLAAPQMLVVGDTQEMFMPLLDGFLCTPEESEPVIDALMEQIPRMFAETRECETILMPAIVAGLEALKASECAGKLLVFHSSLPTAEAPGKLKNRDDRKLLGTDKERTVLTPQNQVYNQLGQDCVGFGCSVDLFLFNNAYIDVATIGQVSRLSGGEIYKYTYFQADIDGERVINDVVTNISRPIAFDAIMRVRTSTGVRPTDFYGHCFMSNTTDVELASIDCDKALAVEVKHDDKLQEDEGIYIQVALLYTSVSGQRRLRIINQALKTCSQMTDLYRSCDLETIMNFISKQAVYKLHDNNPKAVKDGIVQRAAQMLANYRKHCASPSSAGQLILPECMKLLPLYVNCLLKSDAMSGGADMTVDDRSYIMQAVMTMDVPASVSYFYPRLIPLHEVVPSGDGIVSVPAPIRCTIDKMTDQGVYILENGIHMFLWIGLGANQEFVQKVFGAPSAVQVNIESFELPVLKNPLSEAILSIIDQIRSQRHRYMRLSLVRQKEKLEVVFKHFLVEDRGLDSSPGYVDFLCHMHKEIRNLLS